MDRGGARVRRCEGARVMVRRFICAALDQTTRRFIGSVVVAAGVAIGLSGVRAQTPAAAPAASFEVASIKPSNPDPSNPMSMMPMVMPQPGGRFTATNVQLKLLIRMAYELQDFQVAGGPPALMNAKFDITAKAPGGVTLG